MLDILVFAKTPRAKDIKNVMWRSRLKDCARFNEIDPRSWFNHHARAFACVHLMEHIESTRRLLLGLVADTPISTRTHLSKNFYIKISLWGIVLSRFCFNDPKEREFYYIGSLYSILSNYIVVRIVFCLFRGLNTSKRKNIIQNCLK